MIERFVLESVDEEDGGSLEGVDTRQGRVRRVADPYSAAGRVGR